MASKRTVIGTVVGAAIIAVGGYSLAASLGVQEVSVDDTFGQGEGTVYTITAPAGAAQRLEVEAASFSYELRAPGAPGEGGNRSGAASIEWEHAEEGRSLLTLRNSGPSEMSVRGEVRISTDPVYTAYHLMVIVSGMVILGFSAALGARRPRGF